MVRETRHLWVGNLPENVSKDRIKEHFNRYGPVQSVKYLPCKDGEGSSPVSAVTVAFMDIKSACKALQSQHKLDERLLKTDFYDPTGSGDSTSGSVGPPTPEEKGGGPGGGSTPGAKLELSRSSHYYSSSSSRGPNNRQHPSSRYQEDYRHRPRPGQNRNSSSFNQDSVRSSSSSSYRYNYGGWKDSRPRSDQPNYNSSDKCDSSSRLVNNSSSKPLKAGDRQADRTGSGASGSTSLLQKKKHRGRRSRSNSSSDSHRSGSGSRSSSSSSSRSSSSGSGGSSKSPSPSRGRLGKGLGNHLPHTEFDKLCTIVVRNLSDRPTENALKEELSREYKKGGCVVRSVRIVEKRSSSGSPSRNAIITFSDPADVSKALEDSRNKRIFGSLIDVVKYSAHHDDTRPRDGELSEFHPKATRTLFVGNISREVIPDEIHKRFKEFGEILEIDIKKPDYALVQFVDIRSVLKAIRAADGELIGGQRVSLRFGLSVATKCVWVDGVAQDVSEKMLQLEFSQYGKIQDLIINRSRGHALVYFDQLKKATIAVSEVRGRSILGSRLMTDYASHECRTAFFEHCKKSGMDIKERSKPWEQDSDLSERRHDRLQRDRSNESRSSGTSRTGGRKRDEFDEELRRFQTDRGKIESDTERCFTPPYSSSRRGVLSGQASRSPSPPRSANIGGPSPSNSRSDRDRAYSDRDSVVSDGSRHGSPVSRDSWRQSRYKPRTQAISPPGDSRSPADQDSESRRKHRYHNGDSGDYRSRGRSSNSSVAPQDPRIEAEPRLDDKKHYNGRGVDSGLSEDTSSGSSGSVPDVDNAKLSGGRSVHGPTHARRSSTDSAVSRDNDTSSRPTSPGHSSHHIPVYTSNSSLLRVVPSLNEVEPTSAAPKTPSSPSSDGSRPGTPLCDENPENLIQSRSQPVVAPVRLSGSGPTHLRSQNSTEPMSLPLPRFAQDRLSTSPGERSSSHRSQSHQVSPREPRSDPAGNNVNMLKSSQTRPELPKLKIVSPTKSNSRDSSSARDPRLISPSLKSPLSVPVPHAANAGKQPSFVSPASSTDPAAPSSLSVKVGLKDPRLGTGLLTVAVPGPGGVASSPASPSPRLSRPRTPPLPADKEHTPTSLLGNKETKAEPVTELSDRLKVFHENYEAWSVLTRQQSTGSSSSGSARLNLDMRPSQPSAIAQQLLSRKSVFDEDSKRLEKTSEPSETESSSSRPSSLSSFNSTSSTPTPLSAGVSGFPKTAESPLLTSDTPVPPLSDATLQTTRDIHPMPTQHSAMSPIRSGTTSKLTPQLPRQNSNLSPVPSSRQFQFPPTTKSSNDDSSRPLPLPSKAGTSATPMTVPIKPLVDKLSKPAAFTKPSATVTPTLKSTERMTASSTKPTVFTTSATKTVSTATMVPSSQQFKNVEKGEASSTTCSPKPDSNVSEAPAITVSSSTPSNDTDSDPNVSSTTGLDAKKKLDINKDIKTIKKEFDSLTSFKEKKEIGEELFAPSATIIQQVKPKYNKIEKKPSHISAKYDIFNTITDVKKNKDKLSKDKITSSKEKKDKLKVKQKYQHNDLKDFLAADNKSTIKKSLPEKKLESTKKEEKVETKRRLSNASENEDSEPKAKVPKLKSDSDGESEAKKPKSEPMKPMGRIPKLEKKDDKARERTESVKSQEIADKDKDKHKSHLKSKSKHEDRHRHKSTSDKLDDKNRDKHKKKKKEKDKDRDKDKDAKAKLDSSKSRSLSTDEDKHRKKMKKSKDHSKDKERKDSKTESKDKSRDKDKKDKHRDKDKERKRRKEEDERKKLAAEQAARKRKRMEDSSNSDQSNDSSDDENRNFSIFDEPVFDENNPVYFSMYDKVKARRSCVKAKEEEEQKRQEEALRKFAKLKEQRAKREGKIKSADSDDDSMSGGEEDLDGTKAALKDELKLKKKQSFINSSSDSDDEAAREVKQKKKSSPGENRKHSLFKSKRTVVDSSDDDSDDAQKPITSKSLSKIGLDSSDSDNNRSTTVDGASSNKKHSSYLESDSEGSDSKLKSSKTIKSESDHSDSSKHSTVVKNKNSKSSVSDSDSDEGDAKSSVLSKSKKTSKEKASLVKAEPLSTDSEDEKPDISKFSIKKEIKTEKSSNKAVDVKGKSVSSKREKKKVKDESNKEKSLLGQKLKRASLFGTSSEDEANPRNIKPPTPNTSTSKLVSRDQASLNNHGKSVKLNIDQVYSDSDNDKMDSPAVESDSSDGIPSRPPTPSFPSIKTEDVKKKSEPGVKDDKAGDKEKKNKSDKVFDSLLTINVDCAQTKPASAKKSPNTKSPGKSAGGNSLSPGNHRSPMISPSGKPTYLLAHMHDKAASREAEKIHRAQEREMHKKGTDKLQKDVFKARKDAGDAKKVDKPGSKAMDEIEVIATKEGNKDAAPEKVPETLCLSETDSDSNESPKKKSPASSSDEILEVKTVPAKPRRSLESDKEKSKNKLGNRQPSDESTDDGLVIDLDNTKKEKQSVFDFNDDSQESENKPSLERKPLREVFKTNPKAATTSYASFVAGTLNEASSSPSASTEFKNVVIVPDDDTPPASDGVEDKDKDDLVILEKPSKDELEMSIASITDKDSMSEADAAAANLLAASNAEADRKRTVISQEETESAVNALLGESFDSFEAEASGQPQVENMDEDVNNAADDEAAAAVAGLATAMSPGEDWSNNQAKQPEKAAAGDADQKQMDESIENIAAEIRRSSTESVEDESKDDKSSKQDDEKKPVTDEAVEIKKPSPTKTAERRKSRDVFDFNEEEEVPKPSTATTKITPVPADGVVEEVAKPEVRPAQTRVLPISRAPPTRSSPVTSPSTKVTPVPSSVSPSVMTGDSSVSPNTQLRLSIDNDNLSPNIAGASPSSLRSPSQRMRRSTGGNSRESEEESAVTEQKIHMILKQAKQEAERHAAAAAHHKPLVSLASVGINLISQPSTNPSELLIDPKTGQAVRLTNVSAAPTNMTTLTLVTNSSPAQPTVLPPRNDGQVRPSVTRMVTAPAPTTTVQPAAVRMPIQLPTQPLPPESVKKTQPVLLEQNKPVTQVVSTNLPRLVTLPTEPVPMSVANKMTSLPRAPLPPSSSAAQSQPAVSTRPQTSAAPQRQVTSTAASNIPAAHKPAVSTPQFLGPEGQRVSLAKREEQELDLKIKEQHLQHQTEPLSLHSPQIRLQPRDNRELHRPSSTPQPSQLEKEEKLSPQLSAAQQFVVASSHQSMYEQATAAGLDARTLDLLRIADYKYRLELTQQLLALGYPEHLVPTYVEKILRDRIIQESVHMPAAARSHEERPGSVPPGVMQHLEDLRLQQQQQQQRQPLPAHSSDYRSDSPLYPGHVMPHPYAAPPSAHMSEHYRDMLPQPAHQPSGLRLAPSPAPGSADLSRSRPVSPAVTHYTPSSEFTLPHLAAYPICWLGTLGLKNEMANVRMHYVSGNRDLARASLPDKGSTLKIMQRMRLEESQLEGVARKMETKNEHCMLLALPNGSEQEEIELQSRNLRHSFITYLQLKGAAGIVNVSNEDNQPAYIVHVFPSCDFANENLARIAPNLLHRVADIEHLVIVIATVFDVNNR